MASCEMCGREAPLRKASIEGAILELCPVCAQHGKAIDTPVQRHQTRPQPQQRARPQQKPETDYSITENYAKIIRDAREKAGLKQEEFAKMLNLKESQVQKMETGNFRPSLRMAAKLQKMLRIKLIEEDTETRQTPLSSAQEKNDGFTIADFIKKR